MEERYESELTRSATVLDGVDRALERLSGGAYGTCEVCGGAVADADLERDPTRRHCAEHRGPDVADDTGGDAGDPVDVVGVAPAVGAGSPLSIS